MIASVRVSLTVTALFNVSFPRFHMLSQVDAAAVTEEVSLIAVPANSPKEEPLVVSKPRTCPSTGNSTAAMTLKKKITEATSGRVTVREGDEVYFGTVGGEVIIF